jgi:hypothetical protein
MRWIPPRVDLDSKGEFVLDGLRPDRYTVSVGEKKPAKQKDSQPVSRRYVQAQVRPGETTEVEFDLRGGITLAGKVYLGVKPANTNVFFFRLTKKLRSDTFNKISTDDEGQYRVDLPGPGLYKVVLVQDKPGDRTVWVELDRPLQIGKQTSQTQDLHFSDGQLRGRVVDTAGKPLAGASVRAEETIAEGELEERYIRHFRDGSAESQEDGNFQLRPLAPADYRVEVRAMGFATREMDPVSLHHDEVIDLQDVVLDPEISLAIVALGPGGSPLDEAYVRALLDPSFKSAMGMVSTKTDENGMGKLDGLSAGSYTVVGTHPGLAPVYLEDVKVPLKEPAVPFTLRFDPGGSLDVQVLRRNGEPALDLGAQLIDSRGRDVTMLYTSLVAMSGGAWGADAGGHIRVDGVAAGDYSIKAGWKPNTESRKITIKVGQTTSVVLVAEDEESD